MEGEFAMKKNFYDVYISVLILLIVIVLEAIFPGFLGFLLSDDVHIIVALSVMTISFGVFMEMTKYNTDRKKVWRVSFMLSFLVFFTVYGMLKWVIFIQRRLLGG